jgi:hypothetical protein
MGSAARQVTMIALTIPFRRSPYDRFRRGRIRMHALNGVISITYLLAFSAAVYDRILISDWLASHLPL